MRKWNFVALPLLACLILAPLASAQSDDDLRREVDQLKRDLQKVMQQSDRIARENADLRGEMETFQTSESGLEERINALSESLEFARASDVDSVANPIRFMGEFRTRFGAVFDRDFGRSSNNNLNDRDEDDNGFYTDARFLVAMEFDFDKDVTTHFSMQANGLYDNGDTPASGNSGLSSIDLYEGWILIRNIFGRKELSAKGGRQELVFGNELHFGNNDFFSGETFDGTRWDWSSENFDLTFFAAKLALGGNNFNTRDHPYTSIGTANGYDDDAVYGLYFTLKSIQDHVFDIYAFYFDGQVGNTRGTLGNPLGAPANGDANKGGAGEDFEIFTVGIRLDGWFDVAAGLDYNIEFAYQFGELNDGVPGNNDADVEGFVLEVEIGITFSTSNNFRLFTRFYWAEGQDTNNQGAVTDTGFIPLFPERHAQALDGDHTGYRARYGLMDIIPMDNVLSVQLGLTFDPAADWTIGLTGIWAQHDEDVSVPPAGSLEDDLGFEIDLFAEYRYSAQTTFSAGIGIFFANDGAPTKNGAGQDAYAGNDDDIAFLFYMQTRVVF